jgi:hypothetical protein
MREHSKRGSRDNDANPGKDVIARSVGHIRGLGHLHADICPQRVVLPL